MIKMNKSKMRILWLVVALALVLGSLPMTAFAEGSFSAAVKAKSMKVYADAYGKQYVGSLSRKTIVTVESYLNGIAKIRFNGMTGFAKVSELSRVDSFAEEAKTNQSTRVYQEANTASASTKVKSGIKVYVLAINNGIAMVEKGGKVGYVDASHLTYTKNNEVVDPGQSSGGEILNELPSGVVEKLPGEIVNQLEKGEMTQSQLEALLAALRKEYENQQQNNNNGNTNSNNNNSGNNSNGGSQGEVEEPSVENIVEAFNSGKYSNEQLCYMFAVKVMGYNTAAAAGLLSNISAESGFRTNANGDSGRSYGICQWFSSRKTRLLNWCANNNMDSSHLLSQLYFLKYELEKHYPSVHRYMKGVSNDAQGAYDAAYYFCYHFEAPANKSSKSVSRGNSAKNIFYPRYA